MNPNPDGGSVSLIWMDQSVEPWQPLVRNSERLVGKRSLARRQQVVLMIETQRQEQRTYEEGGNTKKQGSVRHRARAFFSDCERLWARNKARIGRFEAHGRL